MKEELWLAVYFNKPGIGKDLLWYNEGRWQEITYFLKLLIKRLIRKLKVPMVFKIRLWKLDFEFYI